MSDRRLHREDGYIVRAKRPRAGKIIIYLIIITCVITIIGLAIAVGVYRNKLRDSRIIEQELRMQINRTGYTGPNACTSVDCSVTAGEMLARMDLSADPCEDFYQYACGAFSNPVNMDPDLGAQYTFGLPAEKTSLRLLSQLNSEGNNFRGFPSSAVKKAKDFYAACMADREDDDEGRAILLQLIEDLGSWPISSESATWSVDTWNVEHSLTAANVMGFHDLVGVGTTFDPRNSSNIIITLSAAKLMLSKPDLYTNGSSENAYKDYIATVLTLLYDNADKMIEWANKIWTFESMVARIYPSEDELKQSNNPRNIKRIGDISSTMPFLNLTTLINQVLKYKGSNVTVDQNTEILVYTLNYVQSFNKLVADFGVNASSMLSIYNVWTAVNAIVPSAGTFFKAAYDTLHSNIPSLPPSPSVSWKDCVSATVDAVGFAVGAIYEQEYMEKVDLEKIDILLNWTRQQFIEDLEFVNWLQPATRAKAVEKARAVTWQIGFPEYFNTAEKLDAYYQELTIIESNLRNIFAKRNFEASRTFSKYGKPADKAEWEDKPTEVNAYYFVPTNQIVILAGIMNKPMYNHNFPESIMYGAMGSVLGHEFTHGFDDSGSTYNAMGNKENWWDTKSIAEYNKRIQCFIDQYNRETFYRQPVSGNKTVAENVADSGGIKLAYNAYLKATEGEAAKSDLLLPGLRMTGKQQFFLGYAQMWCVNTRPEMATIILDDDHSPGPLRVNLVLRNTPQFAEAFSCPDNSKMKPKESDRCELW